MTINVIETARSKGQKLLLGAVIFLAAMPPLIAVLRSLPILPFGAASFGLAVLAVAACRRGGQVGRLSVTAALMGEIMLVTAALTGHPWQLDSHMLYFAALARLVVLIDIPAPLLGAGLVAVQHVGLTVLIPSLFIQPQILWKI